MRKAVAAKVMSKLPPVKIATAVSKLRGGVTKLQQIMVPPHVAMLEKITDMWVAQSIGVAATLGVADHVSQTGTAIETLASKTGANPESLYRLLRALSSIGIFQELEDKKFAMTAMAECLKTDHPQSIRHLAIFQTKLNWEHWAELEYCVKTGKNAIEKVHGEKPFEHLAKHPEKAEVFDRAMTNVSKVECEAVIAAYNFTEFATIADVGGGYGTFLCEILKTHSEIKGLLCDLPHVVEGAKKYLREEGLHGRVQIESCSFFETIPAGADAYMMKHIIHDWSDDEAIQIMKNIRNVIPTTGKMLLVEAVVAGKNEPHFSKFLDLEMLVVTTGKERTKEEYAKIMNKAGFRLEKIVPTVSMASILEATPI